VFREQAGDGALGDVDAELEKFAVDSGSTPQGVGRGHRPDERGDLLAGGWAAASWPAREASPVFAEAAALPTQDGVGRHDDQRLPPTGPESGQAGPEQAVSRAELRPGRCSLVHGQLLAEGQVLEGELAVAQSRWRSPSHRPEEDVGRLREQQYLRQVVLDRSSAPV
jgi:hypothetical protein